MLDIRKGISEDGGVQRLNFDFSSRKKHFNFLMDNGFLDVDDEPGKGGGLQAYRERAGFAIEIADTGGDDSREENGMNYELRITNYELMGIGRG